MISKNELKSIVLLFALLKSEMILKRVGFVCSKDCEDITALSSILEKKVHLGLMYPVALTSNRSKAYFNYAI